MATSIEQVKQYLNDLGVGIDEVDEERRQVKFFLGPLNLQLLCFANVSRDGTYLSVTSYPQIARKRPLDPLRREQVLERINSFNQQYAYGRWSLDEDEDVRVNFQILLQDSELTRRQLWMVIYLMKDLVILQAQCLQLLIVAGIEQPYREELLSGIALSAALDNPSRVGEVCDALCLSSQASRLLHEAVGATYEEPALELEDSEAGETEEPPVAEARLLN